MDVANSMRPFVSTKGKERGLGLPTALFLIRIQDGRLDIQPEEGRGTTVIVTLPIGKGV
jgi:nitrogen-specific signal transduction histidine kinase